MELKYLGPESVHLPVLMGFVKHTAPQVVLDLCRNKNELRFLVETKVQELGSRGIRSLALARQDDEDGVWKMLGILTFLDPPRPDTQETIKKCKQYGVEVKMITGDHLVIAKETSRVLGMGNKIYPADGLPVLLQDGGVPSDLVEKYGEKIIAADGFASVFPEHKYLIVETLRQAGFRCGMTGDGVNDAPALKRADVSPFTSSVLTCTLREENIKWNLKKDACAHTHGFHARKHIIPIGGHCSTGLHRCCESRCRFGPDGRGS